MSVILCVPVLVDGFITHQKHKGPKGKIIGKLDFVENILLAFLGQCQESEKYKPQNGRETLQITDLISPMADSCQWMAKTTTIL